MLVSFALIYLRYFPIQAGKWRLHRFLHLHIGKRKAVVKANDGFCMHCDTTDFIQRTIYMTGTWDEQVARVVRTLRPGDLFVDCGANVGFFSLLAASRGARVIAFEPNPACHAALLANAKLNGFQIDVRKLALSSETGKAVLHVESAGNVGAATLRHTAGDAMEVDMDTLDNQLVGQAGPPALMKIDVEGAEIRLLEGAQRTLAEVPRIVMEVSEFSLTQFGGSKDRLYDIMNKQGYCAHTISEIRRSNSTTTAVYFQYDVLFAREQPVSASAA